MLKNSKVIGTAFFILVLAIIFAIVGKFQYKDVGKIFSPSFFNLFFLVLLVQAVTQISKIKKFHSKVLALIDSISGDLRYSLLIPPMIFGLLPMPAGAMITAEISRSAGEELKIHPKWVFFFNYWFRHVCEFSWPLYGALIIAAGLANIQVTNFIYKTLIYLFIALLIGLLILFTKFRKNHIENERNNDKNKILRNLVSATWPIILIILMLLLKLDLKYSLLLVIAILVITEKVSSKEILNITKHIITSEITIIIISVLIFKGVAENTPILTNFANFLTKHNVPVIILVMLLPMIMAFLTGITSLGIGSTAPILGIFFTMHPYYPYLAYISAITGVLLSPFHLCLISTKEYYKISFKEVYSTITLPILAIQGLAIVLTLL